MRIEEFLPQAPPMVLIDRVLETTTTTTTATALPNATNPFVNEHGFLERPCALELMAQCFAAGFGQRYRCKEGYLAAIKDFRLYGDMRLGETLLITTELCAQIGPLLLVHGVIHRGNELLCEASFKIYVPQLSEESLV